MSGVKLYLCSTLRFKDGLSVLQFLIALLPHALHTCPLSYPTLKNVTVLLNLNLVSVRPDVTGDLKKVRP